MDWWSTAKRAFWSGTVGGILTQVIYGSVGYVGVGGMAVPSSVAAGLACGTGSVAADVAHQYVPSTPIGHLGTGVVELAAAGIVGAGALDYLGLEQGITWQGVALGSASVVGGRYIDVSMGGGASSYIL